MPGEIEVRAFGKLYFLFKERGWEQPKIIVSQGSPTAEELRKQLDIPAEDVEVVFVNHLVCPLATPLKEGDRVAFVPPGYPSIHRFNLGFYGAREVDKNLKG